MCFKSIIFICFLIITVFSAYPVSAFPLEKINNDSILEKESSEEFTSYFNEIISELEKISPEKISLSKNLIEYLNTVRANLETVGIEKIKKYTFYSDRLTSSSEGYKNIEFKVKQYDNIISYNYYYNNKKNNSLEVYCKLNFDTKNAGHCKFYTLYCNQSPSGLEFYSNVEYCTEKEGDIKSCILYYNKSNDKEDSYKTVN